MQKVAIVVLNWNGHDLLEKFLPTLLTYTDPEIADIIVADNASTDDSVKLIRREFPSIQLILLDDNYGFAEGYNRALAQVKHEYVVLLNSDVEVTPGWLEPMLEYLESTENVAACQPEILDWKRRDYYEYAGAAGGFIDRYGYPFCRGRIFSTVEKKNPRYTTIADIFWASGACMMIRLEVFLKAGGFDAAFFAHMEEIDLCWRIKSSGKRIVCIPASTVYHIGAQTLKTDNPGKTYLNFRNNLLMLYKNLEGKQQQKILRIRSFLDYVALFQFLITGKFSNAKAVLQAKRDFKKMKNNYASSFSEKKINLVYGFSTGIYSNSILIDHFLKQKKYFYQLLQNKNE